MCCPTALWLCSLYEKPQTDLLGLRVTSLIWTGDLEICCHGFVLLTQKLPGMRSGSTELGEDTRIEAVARVGQALSAWGLRWSCAVLVVSVTLLCPSRLMGIFSFSFSLANIDSLGAWGSFACLLCLTEAVLVMILIP